MQEIVAFSKWMRFPKVYNTFRHCHDFQSYQSCNQHDYENRFVISIVYRKLAAVLCWGCYIPLKIVSVLNNTES